MDDPKERPLRVCVQWRTAIPLWPQLLIVTLAYVATADVAAMINVALKSRL